MGQLRVDNLGKAYRIYPSRWQRLCEWLLPFGKPRHQLHWVLRGVNLAVQPGEALGIIGANGAGKSTLLKLITGTLQANEGHVGVHGSVAALLELGMGFHPDFSGRQNVFMAGQLLGMSLEELGERMPAIEAFAEIGEAIDQPVRTYSSGMQVRLAFSVATARRPDILIVDEALSVGDAYFQHKSFERIRAFRRAGTTLLIVSHNRTAIQSICDRAVLLSGGAVLMQGEPEPVLDYYNALMADRQGKTIRQEMLGNGVVQTISGSGEASVVALRLLNADGRDIEAAAVGQAVTLEVHIRILRDIDHLTLGFMLKDRYGQIMYGINSHRLNQSLEHLHAGDEAIFRFGFVMRLGKGNYSVSLSLSRFDSHLDGNYEWRDGGMVFSVFNTQQEDFVGSTWLDAAMTVERRPLLADRAGISSPGEPA